MSGASRQRRRGSRWQVAFVVLAIGFVGAAAGIANQTVSRDIGAPHPAPLAAQATGDERTIARRCDPNYSPCIPAYPPDLDCDDLGHPVSLLGAADPHRLDEDDDWLACELVADPPRDDR